MVHVAKELEHESFSLPLLIGGATTNRIHTAVKIAPEYSSPVVHVKDASLAVGIVRKLLSEEGRGEFERELADTHERARDRRKQQIGENVYLPINQVRRKRFTPDWSSYQPPVPAEPGIRRYADVDIRTLAAYIDWSFFFVSWDMKGRFPDILSDDTVGEEARRLYDDATAMIDRMADEKLVTANGVAGIYPASSTDDDCIEIYTDDSRTEILTVLPTLRQQKEKTSTDYYLSLSDYVAPKESGIEDYIGAFAVTAGIGLQSIVAEYESENDDYHAILAKVVGDRLAEAFAEYLHLLVRTRQWAYAQDEDLSVDDLLHIRYRGIRPAPGYPPCPDHRDKLILWDMLDAESQGISLTESCMMVPPASVSGFYYAHPESKYFAVGKVAEDQVEDYARRRAESRETTEKWLRTVLAY
jgi:5-methyltetrahydrofolate--homocysteine methyltransferase